jgi:hypothetical protein
VHARRHERIDAVSSNLNLTKGRLAPARQIRRPNLSSSLAEPRQFQPQKYLEDFEFGQLFLSIGRTYDEI